MWLERTINSSVWAFVESHTDRPENHAALYWSEVWVRVFLIPLMRLLAE